MITQEEMQEKNAAKYNIPMLEKSFELLEFLVNYPSGLTMQELVNLLDTPKTTIYRLLSSMQGMGYLTKDADTQRFSLSKRFLKLGLAALGESSITVDVPISLAKEVGRYIHDKLGDDYIYTVKFDKKAIKELDNWAKASNESDEDIARAERIAHVMDKIDMEIVTSETAIYK